MKTRPQTILSLGLIGPMLCLLIYVGSPKLHHPYLGVFDGKDTWGTPGVKVVQYGEPFNVQWTTVQTPEGVRTQSVAGFGNRPPLHTEVPTLPETLVLMERGSTR